MFPQVEGSMLEDVVFRAQACGSSSICRGLAWDVGLADSESEACACH